jgi:hypothetical protein
MQVFKHMEVVLMLAFGIVCAGAYLPLPETGNGKQAANIATGAPGIATSAEAAPTHVVRVVGRRPTADEKRARGQLSN